MPAAGLGSDPVVSFVARLRQPVRPRLRLWRSLIRGSAAGWAVAIAVIGWNMAFGDNLHEVQPGRTFRAAQMSPDRLRRTIERHGVRTVVNLRGCCADFPWYLAESRVTRDAGISQEDVCLSAIRLPSPAEVRRLIDVLDRAEYPILFHCRQGVDRTGLTATAVRLLEPGVTLAEARRQLGIRYGHVPFNGTENMLRFFDLYAEWLLSIDCHHAPELFRHWVERHYCPGACRGEIAVTADFPADRVWPADTARRVRVVARNTSVREWRLTPGTRQAIHARYHVYSDAGQTMFSDLVGLFDAAVPPGGTVELTLGIPALKPGRYAIQVELGEGEGTAFSQFGIEPFVWEFRVVP